MDIVAVLTKIVQDQQQRIAELEARLAEKNRPRLNRGLMYFPGLRD
jgi:hypothetical protein